MASDDLSVSSQIAAKGIKAQATRLRVISENPSNANSTAEVPGGEPYRRKLVTFRNALDRELEADTVRVKRIYNDRSELASKYDSTHPGANAQGYVLQPNVNPLIEIMDMREAQRSYEANMNVISTSRQMVAKTLELLK
jgi:flagellar basal-body rod protein FlgC